MVPIAFSVIELFICRFHTGFYLLYYHRARIDCAASPYVGHTTFFLLLCFLIKKYGIRQDVDYNFLAGESRHGKKFSFPYKEIAPRRSRREINDKNRDKKEKIPIR